MSSSDELENDQYNNIASISNMINEELNEKSSDEEEYDDEFKCSSCKLIQSNNWCFKCDTENICRTCVGHGGDYNIEGHNEWICQTCFDKQPENESAEVNNDEDLNINLGNVFHNIPSINSNQYSEDSIDEEQTTDYNNEPINNMPPLDLSNINGNINFMANVNINSNQQPIQENITSLLNNNLVAPNISEITTLQINPDNYSLYDLSANNVSNNDVANYLNYSNMISTQSQTINFNQPTTPSDSPPGSPPGNPPGLNQIHTEENSQYSMLHNEDDDNPFAKCKIDKLDYDTDSEQTDTTSLLFSLCKFII